MENIKDINVDAGIYNSEKARRVEEGISNFDSNVLKKWSVLMWNSSTQTFAYVKYNEPYDYLFSNGFATVMRNVSFEFAEAFVMYVNEYKIQPNKKYTHNDICAWTDEFQFVHYIFSKHGFIKDDMMLLRKHTTTIYC